MPIVSYGVGQVNSRMMPKAVKRTDFKN